MNWMHVSNCDYLNKFLIKQAANVDDIIRCFLKLSEVFFDMFNIC